MPSNVFDIVQRHRVEDRASRQLTAIEAAARRAATASRTLERRLLGFGVAAASMVGLRGAKNALIDFNSTMEQSVIQMAGMIENVQGGNWTANLEKARDLVRDLQLKARDSVGTTADMVAMASQLTRPLLNAGLSMSELADMTQLSVVAAKSFGIAADVAARDVDQAMMGMFRSTDPFNRKILEPLGFRGEAGRRKWNALNERQRAAEYKRGLGSQAIRDMAKAQGQSWEGITSTLADNVQMAFGKIGLPLMAKMSDEIKKWNAWLDANGQRVEAFIERFASGLIAAFNTVKDVLSALIANKNWLLALAGIWAGKQAIAAGKGIANWFGGAGAGGGAAAVAGMGGLLGGPQAGALGRALGPAAPGMFSQVASGLGQFALKLGPLIPLTAELAVAMKSAIDAAGEAKYRDEEIRHRTLGLASDFAAGRRGDVRRLSFGMKQAEAAGILTRDRRGDMLIDPREALRKMGIDEGFTGRMANLKVLASGQFASDEIREEYANMVRQLQRANEALGTLSETARIFNMVLSQTREWEKPLQARKAIFDQAMAIWKAAPPDAAQRGKVNVTIQRIEVKSDDPDRFAFDLVESFRDAARNPSSAVNAFREG